MKRITKSTVEKSSLTGEDDESNDGDDNNDMDDASIKHNTKNKSTGTNMMENKKSRGDNIYEIVDVSVTDDNGEICGCFVSLNNTPNAIAFWKTVQEQHR